MDTTPQKPELSQVQRDALDRHNEFFSKVATLLRRVVTEEYNEEAADYLSVLLDRDANRRNNKRYIPLCHIVPGNPQTMYFNIHPSDFPETEQVLNTDHVMVVQNAHMLDTNTKALACSDYSIVCNIGTLMEFLIKRTYGQPRNSLVNLRNHLSEMYWSGLWLVLPKRAFDVCDIVAVPDSAWLETLPVQISDRIKRRDIQPFFDETNANGKPEASDRYPGPGNN